MKTDILKKLSLFALVMIGTFTFANAQKVGFMSSDALRANFPEAKAAEQRVQSIVDEWKRELASLQQQIENMEFESKKNRLIWTDTERSVKDKELLELSKAREAYAKVKFEPNGEYDQIVKEVMKPIETKIYAAVQEVSASDGYDIIWDQSTQPLAYVNFKYDITVKILRKLGVDVSALEKEQNDKIKNDPRNEQKETNKPRRRSRSQREPAADSKPDPNAEPKTDIPEVPVEEERPIERNK